MSRGTKHGRLTTNNVIKTVASLGFTCRAKPSCVWRQTLQQSIKTKVACPTMKVFTKGSSPIKNICNVNTSVTMLNLQLLQNMLVETNAKAHKH